jgi:hypothetical protein
VGVSDSAEAWLGHGASPGLLGAEPVPVRVHDLIDPAPGHANLSPGWDIGIDNAWLNVGTNDTAGND